MLWLQITNIILLIIVILIITFKHGLSEIMITVFIGSMAILCTITAVNYSEPQNLKEKAVQLGVGKFIADEKGNAHFYFVVDGKEIKYERDKVHLYYVVDGKEVKHEGGPTK